MSGETVSGSGAGDAAEVRRARVRLSWRVATSPVVSGDPKEPETATKMEFLVLYQVICSWKELDNYVQIFTHCKQLCALYILNIYIFPEWCQTIGTLMTLKIP